MLAGVRVTRAVYGNCNDKSAEVAQKRRCQLLTGAGRKAGDVQSSANAEDPMWHLQPGADEPVREGYTVTSLCQIGNMRLRGMGLRLIWQPHDLGEVNLPTFFALAK